MVSTYFHLTSTKPSVRQMLSYTFTYQRLCRNCIIYHIKSLLSLAENKYGIEINLNLNILFVDIGATIHQCKKTVTVNIE